jgi:hypothetical protein
MFAVVYVPYGVGCDEHGIAIKIKKFKDIGKDRGEPPVKPGELVPENWLREEEEYENFFEAWTKACEINTEKQETTCLVFSTVTKQLHFPTDMLPGYPYNEFENLEE